MTILELLFKKCNMEIHSYEENVNLYSTDFVEMKHKLLIMQLLSILKGLLQYLVHSYLTPNISCVTFNMILVSFLVKV